MSNEGKSLAITVFIISTILILLGNILYFFSLIARTLDETTEFYINIASSVLFIIGSVGYVMVPILANPGIVISNIDIQRNRLPSVFRRKNVQKEFDPIKVKRNVGFY